MRKTCGCLEYTQRWTFGLTRGKTTLSAETDCGKNNANIFSNSSWKIQKKEDPQIHYLIKQRHALQLNFPSDLYETS